MYLYKTSNMNEYTGFEEFFKFLMKSIHVRRIKDFETFYFDYFA